MKTDPYVARMMREGSRRHPVVSDTHVGIRNMSWNTARKMSMKKMFDELSVCTGDPSAAIVSRCNKCADTRADSPKGSNPMAGNALLAAKPWERSKMKAKGNCAMASRRSITASLLVPLLEI